MSYDLTKPLVIGISSRALFDLENENRIFMNEGVEAYERYQMEHENDILKKGSAYPLVEAFLGLNKLRDQERMVEVIIMSRNNPNTSIRIFNSIAHYKLDITRATFTSGAGIAPYLKAFQTDLFLSANESDVQNAIDSGIAAGVILTGPSHADSHTAVDQIRIAFDGDAVLFSPESERIFQTEGIDAFQEHERVHANDPLAKGPFANFLMTVAKIQDMFMNDDTQPIRTALVTSRNAPAHERTIRTLRNWNVRINEAFFLGGVPKKEILSAFGAHIFFDDQPIHCGPASEVVPSAVVPYRQGEDPKSQPVHETDR